MNSTRLLGAYAALVVFSFLLDWFLDILNLNSILKNRGAVPAPFAGIIDESAYRRSADYGLRRGRFGLLRTLQGIAVLLTVLFTGAPAALDALLAPWGLGAFAHGLAFLAAAALILGLVDLPASLYSRFVIEEEFGFNTTSVRTYLLDAAKGLLVGAVLGSALIAGLYGALAWFGRWWWLAAWGFWMTFQLLMIVVFPTLIAPLFNRFEPLPEGALRNRLNSLAERCGFAHRGIFVMDGSRRSRHSNAYFTGFGRFRRIVIFDTLIEALEDDELEAVLAHEIGHWTHRHIHKRFLAAIVVNLGLFALAGTLLTWPPLFSALGFAVPSLHGLLFILVFYTAPLNFLVSPLSNLWSRKNEYQCDRFAAERTGGTRAMIRALIALSRDNLSNLTPHPAYSFWHYSHPAPLERLRALRPSEDDPVVDTGADHLTPPADPGDGGNPAD